MTDAQQAEARRRSRSWTRSVAGIFAVILLVAVTIGLFVPGPQGHPRDTAGAVIAIFALAVILGLSLWFTAWTYRQRSFQQLFQFPGRRRRLVTRRLRRGRPLSDDDLPVAAAMVNSMQRAWWLNWVPLIPALNFALQIGKDHGTSRWFDVGFLLFIAAATVLGTRQRRRVFRNWDRVAPRYRELHPGVRP